MFRRHTRLLPYACVVVVALVAWVLASLTSTADAFPTGQIRHSGSPQVGGATCANCHNGGEAPASVALGIPSSVEVGQSVAVSVTVAGGPGTIAGLNVATDGLIGLLTATDSATSVTSDELTHAQPLAMVDGQATFFFSWTAPAEPTTVAWYVSAVSANGNGAFTGDSVATTTGSIAVRAAPTPTPTPTATDTSLINELAESETPTPESVTDSQPVADAGAATPSGGAYGFGLSPSAVEPVSPAAPSVPAGDTTAAPSDALAATGRTTTASASIAVMLLGAGASLVIAARRSR